MFYPYKKGEGKCFNHAKEWGRGVTKDFEIVLTGNLEVLAILNRGGGQKKSCHEWGAAKRFRPAIFQLCSPPPPSLPVIMTGP